MTAAVAPVPAREDDAFALLGVTALITIVATFLIDVGIGVLGLPSDVGGLKGAPGIASPVLYHWLARRRRGSGLVPSGVVPFQGFTLRWPVVAVLGGLMILGSAEIGSFLGAFLIGTIDAALGASIVSAVFVSYLVGRWIGVRAAARPILAAAVAVVIARLAGTVSDWILLPPDVRDQLGMTMETLPVVVMAGLLTWGIPALVGAWRGRAAREGAYLTYLVGRVTPRSRATVLEMVYEEAAQARTSSPPPSEAASEP